MARGNYKTGARRDRRIKDPGFTYGPAQVVCPCELSSSVGGGSVEVVCEIKNASNGQPFPDVAGFVNTGRTTTSFVVDSAGTIFPATGVVVEYNVGFADLVAIYTIPIPGAATGAARIIITPLDPAVRGGDGQWIGGGARGQLVT